MKRFVTILAVAVSIFSFASVTVPVSAANINDTLCKRAADRNVGTPSICEDNATRGSSNPIVGPDGIVTRLLGIFAMVIGIAAVIIIIISGMRFVLAGGDSNAISSARKGLLYALVGLVIAGFAQAIVSFVLAKL